MKASLLKWLSQPHIRTPLLVGGTTRALVFLAAFVGVRLLGAPAAPAFLYHGGQPHPVQTLDNFQRWDGYWFLNIARNGYQYHGVQEQMVPGAPTPDRETNITPFPLYPLLIWLLGLAVLDLTLAGMMVSLAAYFVSLVLLYRMVEAQADRQAAGRAVLYLSVYPLSFFYSALYSEALFLMLTLLSLHHAMRRRALLSGLFGLGASLTRLSGSMLALPVFTELLFGPSRRPDRSRLLPALLAGALVSAGWVAYFGYLYGLTGRFWIYFSAQKGWHKVFTPPWTAIWRLLRSRPLRYGKGLLELGGLLLFVPITIDGARWLRPSFAVYLVLGLLMPLSVSNLLGLPRYLMVLFPAYMVLARWGHSAGVHQTIVVGFCLLQSLMMMAWVQWLHSF